MKSSDINAARDWGKSVGRVRRANNTPVGDATDTSLTGELRKAFLEGLNKGYRNGPCGP